MSVELYKHNKEAYEQVEEHFKTSNKTCVIHPTGTGKSFISLKFIDDNINKNILLLAPTNVILDQFCTNIAEQILKVDTSRMSQKEVNDLVSSRLPNITLSTYASAKNQTSNYDCIICDEFHRIGADTWGAGVKSIMDNNPNAKVLGVTATPIRYLDDMRDMSEEIFEGDIASQMTLPEAIVKGILPIPTYINTLYSFEEDIDEIQKQIDSYKDRTQAAEYQKLLDKAKKELQSSEGLDEIFAKNIQNKNGRFIVFCRNKEHMKEMEQKCKEWLKRTNPDIEISEVYSDQGKELNQYYIEYFENNERKTIKLLFSIEMLNEGLHVKNIDGVIMFRPTSSPIIYTQQLGRALSVGHNEHPLIFDIVNNASSLDSIMDVKNQVEKLIYDIISDRGNGIPYEDYPDNELLLKIKEGFKVIEEKKEIIDVLKNLKVDTHFTWDDWYKLAKEYYEQNGNLYIKIDYITDSGAALGTWIKKQRDSYKNKILSDKKRIQLEEIGMIWDILETNWDLMYNELKKYYIENGNIEVPANYITKEGLALGSWFHNNKNWKKKNKLSEDRIKKLEELNIRWDVKEDEWNQMYREAEEYYKKNNNLDVPSNYISESGRNLGKWISHQRDNKKVNTLIEDRIKKLEEIGMIWNVFEHRWNQMYKEAEKYYIQNHNLDIKKDYVTDSGLKLGSWIIEQRKIYKGQTPKKMDADQIYKLEKIGIKWFDDKTDDKLQSEEITDENKSKKSKELRSRLESLLSKYDGESLPSKEEISDDFIDQLNRKKK